MKNQQNSIVIFKSRMIVLAILCLFSMPAWAFDSYHLMSGLSSFAEMVQYFCIGAGFTMFMVGLFKMKRYGEMRTFMSHQVTISQPLGKMMIGVCLLMMPFFAGTLLNTFWGNVNPLAYPELSTVEGTQLMKPIILLIRILGLIGLIRGIFLFGRAGGEQSQPGTVGKALLHILGGLLCMHILNTYHLFEYLLDFSSI